MAAGGSIDLLAALDAARVDRAQAAAGVEHDSQQGRRGPGDGLPLRPPASRQPARHRHHVVQRADELRRRAHAAQLRGFHADRAARHRVVLRARRARRFTVPHGAGTRGSAAEESRRGCRGAGRRGGRRAPYRARPAPAVGGGGHLQGADRELQRFRAARRRAAGRPRGRRDGHAHQCRAARGSRQAAPAGGERSPAPHRPAGGRAGLAGARLQGRVGRLARPLRSEGHDARTESPTGRRWRRIIRRTTNFAGSPRATIWK